MLIFIQAKALFNALQSRPLDPDAIKNAVFLGVTDGHRGALVGSKPKIRVTHPGPETAAAWGFQQYVLTAGIMALNMIPNPVGVAASVAGPMAIAKSLVQVTWPIELPEGTTTAQISEVLRAVDRRLHAVSPYFQPATAAPFTGNIQDWRTDAIQMQRDAEGRNPFATPQPFNPLDLLPTVPTPHVPSPGGALDAFKWLLIGGTVVGVGYVSWKAYTLMKLNADVARGFRHEVAETGQALRSGLGRMARTAGHETAETALSMR